MAGEKDKVTGYVKEKMGQAAGDKRTEAEGKADREKGKVKDIADDLKEGAKGVRDSMRKGWHFLSSIGQQSPAAFRRKFCSPTHGDAPLFASGTITDPG